MSWQEQLRRLDAQLEQGDLTRQQYQARREDVLAEASLMSADLPANRKADAAPTPPKTQPPQSDTTGAAAPQAEPQPEPQDGTAQENPAPPQTTPPPAAPQNQPSSAPESPAVQPPPTRPPRPSAASLMATPRPTTAPSPADQQPTERIMAPGRPGPSPTTPAAARQDMSLPPIAPAQRHKHPVRNHPPQGGSAPDPGGKRGSVPTGVFLAFGVFVALTVIIGIMWLIGRLAHDQDAASPPPAAAPTTTAATELIERLPRLPGAMNPHSSTFGIPRGVKLKLYNQTEADVFTKNKVRSVTWMGSSRGDLGYTLLIAENTDEAAAARTTRELVTLTARGFERTTLPDRHNTLRSYRLLTSSSNVYFTGYTSGRYTVRAAIAKIPPGAASALSDELSVVLDELVRVLPPDR